MKKRFKLDVKALLEKHPGVTTFDFKFAGKNKSNFSIVKTLFPNAKEIKL